LGGQLKKSFTDISDALSKDVLMSYFALMLVYSSQMTVWSSIPEGFYYSNRYAFLWTFTLN
jgi:hypothetical protein